MIRYERGGLHFVLKMFQRKGSVFGTSFRIALPCAGITVALKMLSDYGYIPFLDGPRSILTDNGVWSGFSFLVGFLIVFRTSQAYARFWDGCTSTHLMRAEWYDACSAVVAFCKHSKVDEQVISVFQHTVVRLFSMLHALALAEIEDSNSDNVDEIEAFKFELLDAESIDHDSLRYIKASDSKVELVYQWIQQILVENIDTGILSIPAPLLARVFQEINAGMVQFHEAIKISTIPFPFPYAQTCDCLLLMHYVTTPIVMSQWVSHPVWAFIFSFIQVSILWSLNCIAVEIENPFGQDDNDIDAAAMQQEMNRHLSVLLQPSAQRTPRMHNSTINAIVHESLGTRTRFGRRSSFTQVWSTMPPTPNGQGGTDSQEVARSARRRSVASSGSSRRSSSCSGWSLASHPCAERGWGAEAAALAASAEAATGAAAAAAAAAAGAARRRSPPPRPQHQPKLRAEDLLHGRRPAGDLMPVFEDAAAERPAQPWPGGEPGGGPGSEDGQSQPSDPGRNSRGRGPREGRGPPDRGTVPGLAGPVEGALTREGLRPAEPADYAASVFVEVVETAAARPASVADSKDPD